MNKNTKKHLIRLLYAGIIALGVICVSSFVGIILSLCGVCDFVNTFTTVFVSALSSLLTIGALVLTVKSSNETVALQSKMIALQNDTIEMQRETMELDKAELKNKSINAISKVRNSLVVKTIEIHKNFTQQDGTGNNANIGNGKNNLRIRLYFTGKNIHELNVSHALALSKLTLYCLCALPDNSLFPLEFCYDNAQFMPIVIQDENTFYYEHTLDLDEKDYKFICSYLKRKSKCRLEVAMGLTVKGNDGATSYWDENYGSHSVYNYANTIEEKQIYIFNKCH